jgi:hypothetical protein
MKAKRHAILVVFLILVLLGSNQPIQAICPQVAEKAKPMPEMEAPSAPAETGSSTSLRTNLVRNGGFENEELYSTSGAWSVYTTVYREVEFDYDDPGDNGTYSCLLKIEGSDYTGTSTEVRKSAYNVDHYMGTLSEGTVLNFSYNILSNPNLANYGQVYAYFRLYNGSYYYLYYYLSSSYQPGSNTTWNGYYFFNTTTFGQWNLFSRNVTSDFEASNGPITTDLEIDEFRIRISSPSNPVGMGKLLLDDVHMRNSTGYEYVLNGGFETGDSSYWYRSSTSVKGEFSHSPVCTEGSKAANLSVSTNRTDVYANSEIYHTFDYRQPHYALAPDTLTVGFDWMYQDTLNGGWGQYARYVIWFENETFSGGVYWYLGDFQDQVTDSNSTGVSYAYYYLEAPGFGNRGTWNHFQIDIYDLLTELNLTQVSIEQGEFRVNLGDYDNSSATLLIDRYSMNDYPVGDPGFEVDFSYSDNVPSWWLWTGSKSYWSQSSDSLVGDYAANVTLTSDTSTALFRSIYVEIDQWTYTDFSWYLDALDAGSDSTYSMIEIWFEGDYRLHYMLGTHSYAPGNTTNDAYYYVDGFNTTGSWVNIQRNITHDLNATFGLHDWNMTYFIVSASGANGGKVSVLFDELHFMDVRSPDLHSVSQAPVAPEYNENTDIYVETTDNLAGIESVSVYYRDDGSWIEVEGEYTIGEYTVTLPNLAYGISRQYYIEVMDRSGMTRTDDNAGLYYIYSSTDSVNPIVSISSPSDGITVEGDVELEISANDGGAGASGVAYVEVWSGLTLLNNDSAAPFNFTWDSRMLSNGTKNIGVFAYDSAGNLATDNVTLNIQNDVAPPMTYGLQINPSEPEYGEEVSVSIISEDLNGVKNVTLYYATEQTAMFTGAQTYAVMEMEKMGSLYTATIPAQDYGITVYYYVVAYDVFEQPMHVGLESEPLEYFVRDTQNPAMSVQAPSTAEAVKGVVQFSISAYDDGSGVEEIRFYVDGSLVDDIVGETATFWWGTTLFENGNHTVEFVALDGAGNEVSIALEYEVQNPDAIGGAIESLSGFMATYGVFVGLAGGIVIVLLVQRFLRKRGK